MSVVKLLGRIVDSSGSESRNGDEEQHEHSYGITADPLTQFAAVFAALIHDVGRFLGIRISIVPLQTLKSHLFFCTQPYR